ncbi:hypothetical protein ABLU18_14875, partial [Acinetobacter junii]
AKHMAQEGWSVQRLLRIIQVNLFERKLLRSLFVPDKKMAKTRRTSIEVLLVIFVGQQWLRAPIFILTF